jgi:hypothetical protein
LIRAGAVGGLVSATKDALDLVQNLTPKHATVALSGQAVTASIGLVAKKPIFAAEGRIGPPAHYA